MLIKYLPDAEKFLEVVDRSRGPVLLHLPDDSMCDLRGNGMAHQLLRLLELGESGIRITVSDPKDVPAFIKYMMTASKHEKIAC